MSDDTDDTTTCPSLVAAALDFTDFYETHYRPVLRMAYVLTGDYHAAENLTQDAFFAAHRNWDRVSRYDQPDKWVRRVVANRSVSRWRRMASEAKALVRLREPSVEPVELPQQHAEVWVAVRALPQRQAQVIALVFLEDRSVAEVATILGCGEETVRTHLRRGRARLAVVLGVTEDDE